MKKTYIVHEDRLNAVLKNLEKIGRKAKKFGTHFEVHVEPQMISQRVDIYSVDPITKVQASYWHYYVDAREITINADPVKLNGWTVIARIEALPGTDDRLVTMLVDEPMNKMWLYSDMRCDHCKTIRYRTVCYICRHENGREVQVGSTCLKDFTGIDPESLIDWARVTDVFETYQRNDGTINVHHTWYPVDTVLALACDEVKNHGYRKSSECNSTKEALWGALLNHETPSDEGKQKATEIINWLKQADFRESSAIETQCMVLVEAGACKPTHLGFLGYIPVAYERSMKTKMESTSQHVGNVGERIEISISSAKILTSWGNQFGITNLWKIIDGNGNIYTWKTQKTEITSKCLRGTVKGFTEFRGEKQTEITRCKAI